MHSYTYDAEGKVLQVDGGTTATYVYDVMDQRVRVTTQSDDVEFLFDPFGRKQSSWTVSVNFGSAGRIYWDGGLLAHRGAYGQTFFHHGNYLGTERARTNYQGQISSTAQSGPYGENFNEQGNSLGATSDERTQYTGQEHDNATGTDHFLFRQYQGTLGRWMSPDPAASSYHFFNPQSLNRYAYALGNPLGLIDLLGLDLLCAPVWEETEDPNGGVVATRVGEDCEDVGGGGIGTGFVEAGGSGGGNGGAIGANPYDPNKRLLVCTVNAHGVQNNLPTRAPNRNGAYGVPETPGTAAIDRSQWLPQGSANWSSAKSNAYINNYRNEISGYVPDGIGGYVQVFNGVSDNMGPPSGVTTLENAYPNRVLFELPGGKDLGNVNNMQFKVPAAIGCPHS